MSDYLLEARLAVEVHLGEGPIAFPELQDSLRRLPGMSDADAVKLAQAVLDEYLGSGRLVFWRGRALDRELAVVQADEARRLVEDPVNYRYGDGDEIRSWFELSA